VFNLQLTAEANVYDVLEYEKGGSECHRKAGTEDVEWDCDQRGCEVIHHGVIFTRDSLDSLWGTPEFCNVH